jgi:hypothetical protein
MGRYGALALVRRIVTAMSANTRTYFVERENGRPGVRRSVSTAGVPRRGLPCRHIAPVATVFILDPQHVNASAATRFRSRTATSPPMPHDVRRLARAKHDSSFVFAFPHPLAPPPARRTARSAMLLYFPWPRPLCAARRRDPRTCGGRRCWRRRQLRCIRTQSSSSPRRVPAGRAPGDHRARAPAVGRGWGR